MGLLYIQECVKCVLMVTRAGYQADEESAVSAIWTKLGGVPHEGDAIGREFMEWAKGHPQTELDLSGIDLTVLPNALFEAYPNVTTLNLSGNPFRTIPELAGVTHLIMQNCRIGYFPKKWKRELPYEFLDLRGNNIASEYQEGVDERVRFSDPPEDYTQLVDDFELDG